MSRTDAFQISNNEGTWLFPYPQVPIEKSLPKRKSSEKELKQEINKRGVWNKVVLGGFFFEKLINGGGTSIPDLRVHTFLSPSRNTLKKFQPR